MKKSLYLVALTIVGVSLLALAGCFGPVRTATVGKREFATVTWTQANSPWLSPLTAPAGFLWDTVAFSVDTPLMLVGNVVVRPLCETYPEPLWPQWPALCSYAISPITMPFGTLMLLGALDESRPEHQRKECVEIFAACWAPCPLIGIPYHSYKIATTWDEYEDAFGRHHVGQSYAERKAAVQFQAEKAKEVSLRALLSTLRDKLMNATSPEEYQRILDENQTDIAKIQGVQSLRHWEMAFLFSLNTDVRNKVMLEGLLRRMGGRPSKEEIATAQRLIAPFVPNQADKLYDLLKDSNIAWEARLSVARLLPSAEIAKYLLLSQKARDFPREAVQQLAEKINNQEDFVDILLDGYLSETYWPELLKRITEPKPQQDLLAATTSPAFRRTAVCFLPNLNQRLIAEELCRGNWTEENATPIFNRLSEANSVKQCLNAQSAPVRLLALKSPLIDDETLADYILDYKHPSSERIAAVRQIKKPESLESLESLCAKKGFGWGSTFIKAIEVMGSRDPYTWIYFACKSKNPWVANHAFKNISGMTDLARVAKESPLKEIRLAALEKITDTAVLARVVEESPFEDVQLAALEKITDEATLMKFLIVYPREERFAFLKNGRITTPTFRKELLDSLLNTPLLVTDLALWNGLPFEELLHCFIRISLDSGVSYKEWKDALAMTSLDCRVAFALNPNASCAFALRLLNEAQGLLSDVHRTLLDEHISSMRQAAIARSQAQDKKKTLVLRGLYIGMPEEDFLLLAPDTGVSYKQRNGRIYAITWTAKARYAFFGWEDDDFMSEFSARFDFPTFTYKTKTEMFVFGYTSFHIARSHRWGLVAKYQTGDTNVVVPGLHQSDETATYEFTLSED